jgi:uncharacterized protein (DUF885 family)
MQRTTRLEPQMLKLAHVVTLSLLGAVMASSHAHATPADDLAKLCDSYWQGYLEASPVSATSLGVHTWDDRWDDITPAGIARDKARLEGVLARANGIPDAELSPADRLTRSMLLNEVRNQLDGIGCHFEDWVVDPLGGPQVGFFNLVDITRMTSIEDARNYVKRCRGFGGYLDAHMANLKSGVKQHRTASRDAVRKSLEEIDASLGQPIEKWSAYGPALEPHAGWSPADSAAIAGELRAALAESVKPALARYRDLLRDEILPAARSPEKAGLGSLPGGRECYLRCISISTSLDRSPEDLHALGLQEIARIRKALSELGQKVLGTGDIAEIQKKLRTDPRMHFDTPQAVEAKAREALGRAKAAIPTWFATLPQADCQVKVMGMHEAPNSTIAYYREPAMDGSRPGYYMINTYKPETRPRYEAEALAFHEAIPGHHLQIAIAQELKGVPEFRKHQGVTAYVEGWGLYAERLADEMGLYSGDVDKIGELSFDAWRASRLVVDTGMHAMGWSRQRAIDYMTENTVLAENNIENEVDRYLTWPGQALAYKCGQLEILRLRDEAKQRLGPRFDIKQFHDVVLRNGALALPLLDQQVEAWIAGAGAK